MLKRWKRVKLSQIEFDQLNSNAEFILKNSKTIVFTPNNTGENWLGIKNATMNMFPN